MINVREMWNVWCKVACCEEKFGYGISQHSGHKSVIYFTTIALSIKTVVPPFDHSIHTLAVKDKESERASHRRSLRHILRPCRKSY